MIRHCLLASHRFFIALALVAFGSDSLAAPLTIGGNNIGSIQISGPIAVSSEYNGGANFWANWQLDGGQNQVAEADLRWLQLAQFSKQVNGFPNRPFIDPRSNQSLGDSTADSLPWYDISGDTKAGLAVTGGGDDSWFGDGPYAQWEFAPLTFSVSTLVVSIVDEAAKQARILGGVAWGYSVSNIGGNHVTLINPTDLANTQAVRDAFNTQLALDFPGWSLVVPEPSTWALLLCALAPLAIAGARRQRP